MKTDFRMAAERDIWVQFFALLFIISGVFSIHYLFRGRATYGPALKPQSGRVMGKASTFSKTPKRWVVAPVKRASVDYTTLAAAVAAAGEGDSIFLRPGAYDECVHVSRSVTISGDGDSPAEVTLSCAKAETLLITGGSVVLENLSVLNTWPGNYWAVDLADANLTMRRVKLKSSSSGLRVQDGEATVSDSELEGRRALFVTGRSKVRVSRSKLAGEEAGISADGGEVNLRVEGCRLQNGRGTGLAAGRFASVAVNDTTISDNTLAAVSVYTGARVKISNSRITDNQECGVILDEGGSVELEHVTVSRNKCGVGFSGAGSLLANNSVFTDLEMGAVAIKKGCENIAKVRGSGNKGLTIPKK